LRCQKFKKKIFQREGAKAQSSQRLAIMSANDANHANLILIISKVAWMKRSD